MKTESSKPTVVEVTAPWCGECRAMKPSIEAAADRHPNVDFVVIDSVVEPDAVRALGVKGTPTVIGYAGSGVELVRSTGRLTSAELESVFRAVASDTHDPPVGRSDVLLRVGAGAILVFLGLASGPVWPLVGIGAVIGLVGSLPMRKQGK